MSKDEQQTRGSSNSYFAVGDIVRMAYNVSMILSIAALARSRIWSVS